MKEKEVIQNLKVLKNLKPPNFTILQIKKNIYASSKIKQSQKITERPFTNSKLSPALALITVFALILFILPTLTKKYQIFLFDKIVFHIRMLIEPNDLRDSVIAVSQAQKSFNQLKKETKKERIDNFSYFVLETGEKMAKLNLQGIPNIYSASDCKRILTEYNILLESAENFVQEEISSSLSKEEKKALENLIKNIQTQKYWVKERLEKY